MRHFRKTFCRHSTWMALGLTLFPGCFNAFSQRNAREVSCEKLLQISEQGRSDHLQYVGSDFSFHYVFDNRKGHERSYKVAANSIKLVDTFGVGDDSYVLHPWMIEGKKLGIQAEDELTEMQKSARKTKAYALDMRGAAQAIVQSAAEPDIGEEVGDDQLEPGGIETP
jgi:hypothetical protein